MLVLSHLLPSVLNLHHLSQVLSPAPTPFQDKENTEAHSEDPVNDFNFPLLHLYTVWSPYSVLPSWSQQWFSFFPLRPVLTYTLSHFPDVASEALLHYYLSSLISNLPFYLFLPLDPIKKMFNISTNLRKKTTKNTFHTTSYSGTLSPACLLHSSPSLHD